MTLLACALAVSALAVTAAEQSRPSIEYRPSLLIQLSVPDLDRAISFYTTILGFTMTERRDDLRFAHLDTHVPGLQIGLNAVPEPKRHRQRRAEHRCGQMSRTRGDCSNRAA